MSLDIISTQSEAIQGYKSPIFGSPKTVTPTKPFQDSDEWNQCYEVTDNIVAIYPTTLRIPYPFAIPRESYDDMSESQKKAVCWMWYNLFDSCRGGVLADSLANNLVQVTQFLHGLCLPRLVYKCLLVVPTQAVDLWVSALLQLAPRVRVIEFTGPQRERRLSQVLKLGGIVVTTYGIAMNDLVPKSEVSDFVPSTPRAALVGDRSAYGGTNGVKSVDEDSIWDVIVLDQADRLKDSTSKTTEALSRLQGNVNLLLTSHPILKHPKDLYTLFDFACEADIFGSYEQFKDRFEIPIHRSFSKRADDMDRQLAAMARIQLANIIDTQYWQNWNEIMTPGGTKRPEALPAFCATPTPFKKSSSLIGNMGRDVAATPSFTQKSRSVIGSVTTGKKQKKNSTTNTTTPAHGNHSVSDLTGLGTSTTNVRTPATGRKKRNQKQSLMPVLDVIILDDDDHGDTKNGALSTFGIDDLENSIANLNMSHDLTSHSVLKTSIATPYSKIGSRSDNPISIDLDADELIKSSRESKSSISNSPDVSSPSIRPFRRTPVRNVFFSSVTSLDAVTPTKLGISGVGRGEGEVFRSTGSDTPSSVSFSPDMVKARQRASFGRISLLDERNGETEEVDGDEEADAAFAAQFGAKWSTGSVATPLKLGSSSSGSVSKKSLTSLEWPSTKTFLKWRESFALRLFGELNKVIFNAGLPKLTITWRNMKNCAGLYHYKDSSITLSSSLLTNSARLTSTLAHEMAHAATHLLDRCPNDRHGPVWQKWARIGHARYPSIVTGSVYHNYCSQNLHPDD